MKRVCDVLIAAIILLISAPVLVCAMAAVRVTLGAPVLFRQQRPGLNAQPFFVYKLRTMNNAVGGDGAPLPDSQRLTTLGRLLRKTSIDELPQLFNVLRGDMSLVGPRPLLMHYLPLYSVEQARRHEVRPGITGWAQIHGRNAIEWADRLALDVWYVDHHSFRLDCYILWQTIWRVVAMRGVSGANHATMTEFRGEQLPMTLTKSLDSHPTLNSHPTKPS